MFNKKKFNRIISVRENLTRLKNTLVGEKDLLNYCEVSSLENNELLLAE